METKDSTFIDNINSINTIIINKITDLSKCAYKNINKFMIPMIDKKPIVISLEGNIGSGKSTLLKHIKDFYKSNGTSLSICFLDEPVELWNTIRDSNGVTILEKYYENTEKYAFAFQMMAYISRLSLFRNALKQNYDVIITERSVYTDCNVFAQMLYEDHKLEEIEFIIYKKWFDEFAMELPEINYIYVKTDPDVAYQRVMKRSRQGETIPLAYLEKCHEYHENWLKNIDHSIRIFDANCDITEMPDVLDTWLERIDYFINKLHAAV